jgi:hypothetical protein
MKMSVDKVGFKRRRTLIGAILLGAMGFALLLWKFTTPAEPVYRGKPLGEWLEWLPCATPWGQMSYVSTVTLAVGNHTVDIPGNVPCYHDAREAYQAVRQIGTNAIPALLWRLNTKDSSFRLCLIWLLTRQKLVPVHLAAPFQRRGQALAALMALGPAARPAIADLRKLARSPDLEVRISASTALKEIDPSTSVSWAAPSTSSPDGQLR